MIMLSVIIITKDAANDIRRCLDSIKWADEIIILDSGSSDDTLAICAEYTSQLYSTDWPGFGIQKNRALAKAKGKWILSIDADEALSPELTEEIKQLIYNPAIHQDAYLIRRTSYFLGKKISYGDWRNDKVVRLFQNKAPIQFTPVIVHEKIVGYDSLGQLRQVIVHNTVKNMSQVLIKLENYSTFGAQLAFQQGKKTNLFKAVARGLWCFIRGYFIRFGWLDGGEGFILAFSNACGVFYRYVKLWCLYTTRT